MLIATAEDGPGLSAIIRKAAQGFSPYVDDQLFASRANDAFGIGQDIRPDFFSRSSAASRTHRQADADQYTRHGEADAGAHRRYRQGAHREQKSCRTDSRRAWLGGHIIQLHRVVAISRQYLSS